MIQILLCVLCFSKVLGDTRAVAIVFRHGHRNPSGTYPKDSNRDKTWPGGFDALTEKGFNQMHDHGARLHERYHKLTCREGIEKLHSISCWSSSYQRTLKSAQSFMEGFLNLAHNSSMPDWWNPVTLTILAEREDNMLLSTQACPRYDQQFASYLKNPPIAVQEFIASQPNFYKNLADHTGLHIENVVDAISVYDILQVQKDNRLRLDDWAEKYLANAAPLVELVFELYTYTDYMKKAKQGALVTNIIDKFEAIVNGTDLRTVFVYSGHHITITGISRIFGFHDTLKGIPDYGATLSFELEKKTNNILVYYWEKADTRQPKQLPIPKCEHPCTVTTFRQVFKSFIFNHTVPFEAMCENLNAPYKTFEM